MAINLMSMVEARLPPGFRFHLRDGELVLDYLDVHHLLACHCWTTVVEEEEPRDPRVSGKSDGMPV